MAITKLIADSGATKAEWCLLDGSRKKTIFTQGISPYFLNSDQIQTLLLKELCPFLKKQRVSEVHYYGTGMQGLADGYFVIPYTIGNYLADEIRNPVVPTNHEAFDDAEKKVYDRINQLMNIKGSQPVESFHKRLGRIIWNKCGMARNAQGLQEAIKEVRQLKEEFWKDVTIPGGINEMNPELDKAQRVADFIELGELMCKDALYRKESCGGHFREESQTEEGEAKRDDENFSFVSAWEYKGESEWQLNKEPLNFEIVKPTQRSYK